MSIFDIFGPGKKSLPEIGSEFFVRPRDPWGKVDVVVVIDTAPGWVRIKHKNGINPWAVEMDVFLRLYRTYIGDEK